MAPGIGAFTLPSGAALPRLIRGGWQLHAAASPDPDAEARRILAFMAAGVTAFETSDTYRHVDEALRLAIRLRRDAGLPPPRVHARITLPVDVADACRGIADRLGVTGLDLVQIQDWSLDEDRVAAAAFALDRLRALGLVRDLGLMNMAETTLGRLWTRGVRPLTVQVQLSLLDRRPLDGLAAWARGRGVGLLAYGTLAGSFLSGRWLGAPDPGLAPTAAMPFHAEYRAMIEAFGGWSLFQDLLTALDGVARDRGTDIETVSLSWVLDRPGVAAALVGGRDPGRAAAWQAALALHLAPAERGRLDAVLGRARGPSGPVGALEREAGSLLSRAITTNRE